LAPHSAPGTHVDIPGTQFQAASGAGFTPAKRAGGLGGAPLAPPSSKKTGAGFTPAKRAGGREGREVERSETSANLAYTTRHDSVAPRTLGGAPLAPIGSHKLRA